MASRRLSGVAALLGWKWTCAMKSHVLRSDFSEEAHGDFSEFQANGADDYPRPEFVSYRPVRNVKVAPPRPLPKPVRKNKPGGSLLERASNANKRVAMEIYCSLLPDRHSEYFLDEVYCEGRMERNPQSYFNCVRRLLVQTDYFRWKPFKDPVVIEIADGVNAPEWVMNKSRELLLAKRVEAPKWMFHKTQSEPKDYIKFLVDTAFVVHVKDLQPKNGHHLLLVYFNGRTFRVLEYFPPGKAAHDRYMDLTSSMLMRHFRNRQAVLDCFAEHALEDPLVYWNYFNGRKQKGGLD